MTVQNLFPSSSPCAFFRCCKTATKKLTLSFFFAHSSRRRRRQQQQASSPPGARRPPRPPWPPWPPRSPWSPWSPRPWRPSQRRPRRLRVPADFHRPVQDVRGGGFRARHRDDPDEADGIQKSRRLLLGELTGFLVSRG